MASPLYSHRPYRIQRPGALRYRVRQLAIAGALACGLVIGTAGIAQAALVQPSAGSLQVSAGSGTMLTLPADAVAVFVADPDVADIHVPTPRTVFVLGKKSGTTTLFALGPNNHEILRKIITVATDTAAIQQVLDGRFPHMNLKVSSAPGSLMVSGSVSTAADADAVVQMLQPYLHPKETLVNRLSVAHPIQVLLRVRITEVDRDITQKLGINWNTLSKPGNFQIGLSNNTTVASTLGAFSVTGALITAKNSIEGVLDALDSEGLLTLLAEPNLVAMSGQSASFLAGGELPVPVPQAAGASGTTPLIAIDYKPYGVSLNFSPTVLADNRISLDVKPEVSEIDPSNSITVNGISVPALTVRRMQTTVELSSGQSFAIGGLLQSTTSDTVAQLPGLGKLPVLGKLFSSKSYQSNKTELVVIVTPYLVNPTGPGRLHGALDDIMRPSSDIEFAARSVLGADPLTSNAPRLVGSAGFVY